VTKLRIRLTQEKQIFKTLWKALEQASSSLTSCIHQERS